MSVLGLITSIIGILAFLLEKKYSPEATIKREVEKRDKEIAEQDHAAKSKRLSDLLDRVRNKNRSNPK